MVAAAPSFRRQRSCVRCAGTARCQSCGIQVGYAPRKTVVGRFIILSVFIQNKTMVCKHDRGETICLYGCSWRCCDGG